jgi:hypothetical protein
MHSKKQRASWVPALIKPPGPFAPLQEWLDYRDGLNVLEAGLRLSHPDMDWLDGMRTFKAEADAVIARRRAARRKSRCP